MQFSFTGVKHGDCISLCRVTRKHLRDDWQLKGNSILPKKKTFGQLMHKITMASDIRPKIADI